MTRYRLDIIAGDYGLDNKDISFLFRFLSAKITQNTINKINHKIKSIQKNNRDYGLLQLNQNVLIGIIKTPETNTFLNLGYPFPISIKKIDLQFHGYTVNFYLRGENIRCRQRKYIFGYFPNAVVHKIDNAKTFQEHLKTFFSNHNDYLAYVDLYRFIGDGILGLFFIDSLRAHFNTPIEQTLVFSRSSGHMPCKYDAHHMSELVDFIRSKDNFTIVIPNLLDNQFNEFMDIINNLKNKNVLVIVPSRNMFIEISGNKTQIYWYKIPDILLTNQPIVEYMQQCTSVFTGTQAPKHVEACAANNNLFIDPFSSLKEKTIPLHECLLLCQRLTDQGFNVFVSNGLNRDEYINELKKNGINIIKDNGLKDLRQKFKEHNIGLVISTDSSIAHLSAYLRIPTIVLYRSYFWDSNTIQSMTNDSPGGFCRADLPMFPLIDPEPNDILNLLFWIKHNPNRYELEHEIDKFCFADDKTVLQIHKRLMSLVDVSKAYNPDVLLHGILNKSNKHNTWHIAHNIWANLPQYKISRFYL